MSKTAKELHSLIKKENYFKFLWAMVDEIEEDKRSTSVRDNTGTIISRYSSMLEYEWDEELNESVQLKLVRIDNKESK